MKHFFLTLIVLIFHCQFGEAKWKIHYGVQTGLSRNILNHRNDIFIAQLFNVERLYAVNGYTSFVPGITLRVENQHFFCQTGLDFNRIQTSSTEYSEYAYLSGNAAPHYYYNFINRSTRFDKLNVPVCFGLHLMQKHFIQPVVSVGWVFGKVVGARYSEHELAQSPTDGSTSFSQTTLNPFGDDSYKYTKSFTQTQYSLGMMIGQHWQLNFSIRQGRDLSIQYAGFVTDTGSWENFIPFFSLQHKEKLLSLNYWFR